MKTIQIEDESWRNWKTPRWKTAIARRKDGDQEQYSSPMAVAIAKGVIDRNHTLFDYGCGRGGDLRRLQLNGYQVDGFDPYWSPRGSVAGAEDLSLIYVLNVIEDAQERDELLRSVFGLCDRNLLVAVRIDNSNPHEEVTSKQTFQKYYADDELATILEDVLGREAIVRKLKTGIFVASHRHRLTVIPGSVAGAKSKPATAKAERSQQHDLNLRLVA
ncbi:hypothetical protein IQ268_16960 [Oculatella sp. LEGE 06141]|uniref:hypothetical protein n=1 Tax=Oculatella sp. LEGE 06141 TaxID=1828648 RepID=UPI00187E7C1A|nr:hypothetical protein [Oculatella sp. LEGE 06141]MBE9180255.1 hypothetical protein [Oculatella sp. LEGE 06141]